MRPLRNPVIQGVLAWLLAGWMRFCFATIRWTYENRGRGRSRLETGRRRHLSVSGIRASALAPACWPLDRAQEVKALISLSPDGQFIARAVGKDRFPRHPRFILQNLGP
jgi:lysophospholipid acyltransferase (LPLAT)-like uncharacterized protein